LQLNLAQLAEQIYTAQRNVPWLSVAYMAAVLLLPVGLHTDFSVFTTRIDMLFSLMPPAMWD
jgi:hypothetical protein